MLRRVPDAKALRPFEGLKLALLGERDRQQTIKD